MKKVPDPRCAREKEHECAAMLTYLIMAYIVGRCSLRRSQKWAKSHLKKLKKHLKIKKDVASVSTLQRLLAGIDEDAFVLVFTQWMAEMLEQVGIHIIIDGKALRGATEKIKDGNTPYILNVVDMATKLVLTQMAIDCKKNEISTIPELLERMEINRNTVLIDAIGTQTAIMERILSSGGHYFLVVKKNNLSAYEEILGFFRMLEEQMRLDKQRDEDGYEKVKEICKFYSRCRTVEKNRERHEHREAQAYNGGTIQSRKEEVFDSIRCIGQIRNIRIPIEKDENGEDITRDENEFLEKGSVKKPKIRKGDGFGDDVQIYGIIADYEMTAEEMAETNRKRWVIEDNLHHVLDDVFREDRSTAVRSKNNLALIRKFAYNLIQTAIIQTGKNCGIMEMMDEFADNWSLLEKYIFSELTPIS